MPQPNLFWWISVGIIAGSSRGRETGVQLQGWSTQVKPWWLKILSQVLGQWLPEEHQGTQWHRGQEQLYLHQLTYKYGSRPWTHLKVQSSTPSLHFHSEKSIWDTVEGHEKLVGESICSAHPHVPSSAHSFPTMVRHLVLRAKHMTAKSFSFRSSLPPSVLLLSIFLTLTPQI